MKLPGFLVDIKICGLFYAETDRRVNEKINPLVYFRGLKSFTKFFIFF